MDEFVGMLDECMAWYRDKRIKTVGLSIMDCRHNSVSWHDWW
ncbi:integrase [Bifidobacterium adolescentis]|nr:integrase [Bifidobacterium adolescentis]MDB1495364.1 integrase [Bifidobacterium adolescentis]